MNISQISAAISQGAFQNTLARLHTPERATAQQSRMQGTLDTFAQLFGAQREVRLFSAPGRTEIGGNHTDHQRGRVLAASVNMDVLCVASPNNDQVIRIKSEGYRQDDVDLRDLDAKAGETNKAISLIRGIAARFQQLGYQIGGFDACTTSTVLKGSGLSSSAAFEVAVGVMLNHLYNSGAISPIEIAQIAQFAENTYFGKPSGLMDQMASSVGSFVAIDFRDPLKPVVEPLPFDLAASGHSLCIVDTGGNHADLTHEYASIPQEMGGISALFGAKYLRDVGEDAFAARLPELRAACGDRAVLRAMHFFGDNRRVLRQADALRTGDFDTFKQLVLASGRSSQACLQNVFACSAPQEQGVSLALALSEKILEGKGAWRVHGGGFGGTIQAFVPSNLIEEYRTRIEQVFGPDSCHILSIRPVGGCEITAE